MGRSHLEVQGMYTPGLRFAFTNIDNEDFTSYWGGVPIIVKAGESIELSDITPIPERMMGHNLAIKMTMELTDKVIMKEAKMDELTRNQPYYRSPIGLYLNVANQRKVYEDKILRQMTSDEEGPATQYLRQKLMAEIQAGGQVPEEVQPVTSSLPSADFRGAITNHKPLDGFSEISARNQQIKEVPKAPVKTKKLGRPAKIKDATPTEVPN